MFTLFADWRLKDQDDLTAEIESMMSAHRRYADYLAQHQGRFPQSAFAYASADWRNNFSDHRAPHDSCVSELRFVDRSLPRADADRDTDLEIVLFGAYHDGHLHLQYLNVQSFALSSTSVAAGPTEVYRDEVRLSDDGLVVHEIEFLGADNWLIVCKDLEFKWVPLPASEG